MSQLTPFISFLKSYHKILSSILFPSVLIALLDFSLTYLLSQIFFAISTPGDGLFSDLFVTKNLVKLLIVLAGIAIFLILRLLSCRLIYKRLYSSVYSSSVILSQEYFRDLTNSYHLSSIFSRDGRLQKLFVDDVSLLTNGIFVPLSGILVEVIIIALIFCYMLTFVPLHSLLPPVLIFIPFFLLLNSILKKNIHSLGLLRESTASSRQKIISNLESSLPEVFIYRCFDFASRKLYSINRLYADVNQKHTTIVQVNRVAFDSALTYFVLLFFLLSRYSTDANAYSTIFAPLAAILLRLVPSFSRILQLSQGIFYLIPLAVKLQDQFNTSHPLDDFCYSMNISTITDTDLPKSQHNSCLSVEHIDVSRHGLPIITSGSLLIPHGSLVSIFGRSGSGKSSLARALFLSMRESGLNVCLLRQRPGPVSSLIIESIALENIETVDLSQLFFSSNSAGLDSDLLNAPYSSTRDVSSLSGGQLQRLDLARTFYSDFDYIILDEFTSALDAATEKQILDNLYSKCHEGLTVICFSHRSAVKSFSSYSYYISNCVISCSFACD